MMKKDKVRLHLSEALRHSSRHADGKYLHRSYTENLPLSRDNHAVAYLHFTIPLTRSLFGQSWAVLKREERSQDYRVTAVAPTGFTSVAVTNNLSFEC